MNRIEQKFKELKKTHKKAFIAFITAGYPSIGITKKLILEFAKRGVDIIEIGVPFSDPMADGPIIQESSQAALKNKINLNNILNLVRDIRKTEQIPICLMTYYNPIFCFGEKRFIMRATQSGVDGVIIPDLPPEEAGSLLKLANKYNLDVVCFISPTTTLGRMKYIAGISKGFIYYLSLTGVTGPRQALTPDLISQIKKIKGITKKQICVGFGISNPRQIKQIYKIAEGAIVGSAIIKKIKDNLNSPNLVKKVADFISYLKNV